MRRTWVVVVLLLAASGVAAAPRPTDDERLYFAVELRRDGSKLAAPRLIGLAGHHVHVERRGVGQRAPAYRLLLATKPKPGAYEVTFDVELAGQRYDRTVTLEHGEEAELRWRDGLQATLLLMRVDSAEFRALMRGRPPATSL